jgi:hypothetical protein
LEDVEGGNSIGTGPLGCNRREITLEQGPGGCDRREMALEQSAQYELAEKSVYRTKFREGGGEQEENGLRTVCWWNKVRILYIFVIFLKIILKISVCCHRKHNSRKYRHDWENAACKILTVVCYNHTEV